MAVLRRGRGAARAPARRVSPAAPRSTTPTHSPARQLSRAAARAGPASAAHPPRRPGAVETRGGLPPPQPRRDGHEPAQNDLRRPGQRADARRRRHASLPPVRRAQPDGAAGHAPELSAAPARLTLGRNLAAPYAPSSIMQQSHSDPLKYINPLHAPRLNRRASQASFRGAPGPGGREP